MSGIPISVSYTFLDTRYLTLYALAGGSIEKCVAATQENAIVAAGNESDKNTFKNEKIDSKPWQGSLNIGAGVQFNITDHYGLFAEPLLSTTSETTMAAFRFDAATTLISSSQ